MFLTTPETAQNSLHPPSQSPMSSTTWPTGPGTRRRKRVWRTRPSAQWATSASWRNCRPAPSRASSLLTISRPSVRQWKSLRSYWPNERKSARPTRPWKKTKVKGGSFLEQVLTQAWRPSSRHQLQMRRTKWWRYTEPSYQNKSSDSVSSKQLDGFENAFNIKWIFIFDSCRFVSTILLNSKI